MISANFDETDLAYSTRRNRQPPWAGLLKRKKRVFIGHRIEPYMAMKASRSQDGNRIPTEAQFDSKRDSFNNRKRASNKCPHTGANSLNTRFIVQMYTEI